MKEVFPAILQLLNVKLTGTVNDSVIDVSLKLTMFTNMGVLYFASRNFSSLYYYVISTTNYILLTTSASASQYNYTSVNNTILYWRNSISSSTRAPPVYIFKNILTACISLIIVRSV